MSETIIEAFSPYTIDSNAQLPSFGMFMSSNGEVAKLTLTTDQPESDVQVNAVSADFLSSTGLKYSQTTSSSSNILAYTCGDGANDTDTCATAIGNVRYQIINKTGHSLEPTVFATLVSTYLAPTPSETQFTLGTIQVPSPESCSFGVPETISFNTTVNEISAGKSIVQPVQVRSISGEGKVTITSPQASLDEGQPSVKLTEINSLVYFSGLNVQQSLSPIGWVISPGTDVNVILQAEKMPKAGSASASLTATLNCN